MRWHVAAVSAFEGTDLTHKNITPLPLFDRLFANSQAPLFPIPTTLTGATPDTCYVTCSLDFGLPAIFWFAIIGPTRACVCSLSPDVVFDPNAMVRAPPGCCTEGVSQVRR